MYVWNGQKIAVALTQRYGQTKINRSPLYGKKNRFHSMKIDIKMKHS